MLTFHSTSEQKVSKCQTHKQNCVSTVTEFNSVKRVKPGCVHKLVSSEKDQLDCNFIQRDKLQILPYSYMHTYTAK